MAKRLTAYLHHLHRRAGQERGNWENLTRLARRGWEIDLVSFSLSDWPQDLPIRWHRVPGAHLPTHVMRMRTYRFMAPLVFSATGVPALANGTDIAEVDVRIAQYVAQAALNLSNQGYEVLPNANSGWRRMYQTAVLRDAVRRERIDYARTKAVIAISGHVARDLRERTMVPESVPISVVRYAADIGDFGVAKQTTPPTIVLVGSLERKGIEKALRVLGQIKDVPWRFVALGKGRLEHWRREAQKIGIADRVSFPGFGNSREWFERASILLLPCPYEPFGLVLTEAISAGCLPIASSECGAWELWPERPDWIAPARDATDESWAHSLRRAVVQSDERAKVVKTAAEAMQHWSWDQGALQYERILLDLTPR